MKAVIDNTICKDALKLIVHEILAINTSFMAVEQEVQARREIMSKIGSIATKALGQITNEEDEPDKPKMD
jgi:hypothetical protein